MKKFVSTGDLCKEFGLSLSTIYRWIKLGKIKECFYTIGGHRRFDLNEIKEFLFPENKKPSNIKDKEKKVVTYARVSSHDQKNDLITQQNKLKYFCDEKKYLETEHLSDLGSGLNYNKPGLKKLFNLILNKQIDVLIINHKDRLLRFGSEIIFNLCKFHNVEVIILEHQEKNFDEELVSNVIELMTVFCAKMYGKRSHKNKLKKPETEVVELLNVLTHSPIGIT